MTEALVAEANGTTASGRAHQVNALTKAGCLECHSNPNAPGLLGILGSEIAAQPGVTYSAALRDKKNTWTEENLRAFLKDTEAFAPGTTMPNPSLPEAEIEEIITLLKEQAH